MCVCVCDRFGFELRCQNVMFLGCCWLRVFSCMRYCESCMIMVFFLQVMVIVANGCRRFA